MPKWSRAVTKPVRASGPACTIEYSVYAACDAKSRAPQKTQTSHFAVVLCGLHSANAYVCYSNTPPHRMTVYASVCAFGCVYRAYKFCSRPCVCCGWRPGGDGGACRKTDRYEPCGRRLAEARTVRGGLEIVRSARPVVQMLGMRVRVRVRVPKRGGRTPVGHKKCVLL